MKDRNIICTHYARAGECAISKRECHAFGQMQHCPDYAPRKGSKPIRPNLRKSKRNKSDEKLQKQEE